MKRYAAVIVMMIIGVSVHALTLKKEVTVTAPQVMLSDIITDRLPAGIADSVVMTAPSAGGYSYMYKRDIERKFQTQKIAFAGPERITVNRKGYEVDWDRIEKELSLYVRSRITGDSAVTLKSSRRVIYADDPDYSFIFTDESVKGGYDSLKLNIVTRYGTRTIPLSIYTAVYVQALVPKRLISRHEKLSPEMFTTERVDRGSRSGLLTATDDVALLRSKCSLQQGKPITFDSVENIPDVIKGDTVQVILTKNRMTVELRALALDDGRTGDQVDIRLDTGKILTASVTGKGTAAIREGL